MKDKKIKELKKKYFKGINVSDNYILDFVNHIWHNVLEDDIYLTIPISPLMDYGNLIKLFERGKIGYKVQTREALKRLNDGEMGLIVNIDWRTSKEIYTPDELTKTTYISVKPEILGVYLISNTTKININLENALILANSLGVNLLNFAKEIVNPEDYESLVNTIVVEYLMEINELSNIELRDKLINKYRNDIITAYRLISKEEAYNAVKFVKSAVNYIRKHEYVKGLNI